LRDPNALRGTFARMIRAAVVTAACVCAITVASSASAQAGATYESLKNLPDFAGGWTPLTEPFVLPPPTPTAGRPPAPAPTPDTRCAAAVPKESKPDVLARCREALERDSAVAVRARAYCERQSFTGRPPAGGGGAFEILFTPGRVTMAIESGLVRRIYMRDKPPANALDKSRSGTSIGRWEGKTLVVETTGLDPNAPIAPGSTLGPGAHVT
jgi:hypothetical protein